MRFLKTKFLCIFAVLLSFFYISTISCASQKEVQDLVSYLSSLKSVAIEFTQTSRSTNQELSKAQGVIVIEKPYKFRCDYYPPFPLLIVGNKNYVSVYDHEMDHLSRIAREDNLFTFLLVDTDIKIDSDEIEFLEIKNENSHIYYKIYYVKLDKTLEIFMNRDRDNIQKIKILEAGQEITMNFNKIHQIKNINRKLFNLKDPTLFGPPMRMESGNLTSYFDLVR